MSISLIAVGDISFGDSPKCLGFGVKSKVKKKGAGFIFEKIKDQLNADIVFGNLEAVLSDEGLIPYDFASEQMRGPVECVDSLSRAGFNVLNIANNHMLQHGEKAFWDCIERLKKKNIAIVGLKGSGKYYSEPAIINIKKKTIGFLGFSFEEDNRLGKLADFGYAACGDTDIVCSDVRRLKKDVDFVIVSLHWGLEFALRPSNYLVEMARRIIDAGTNVILGHHPHVVQCVERYNDGVVCYSLGNFIFDMKWNKLCTRSVIVQFELDDLHNQNQFRIFPVRINSNFQPELDDTKNAKSYWIKLIKVHMDYEERDRNVENENSIYYKKVAIQQIKDTMLSNLFLLATVIGKTPLRYLPGRLVYIMKKSF